MATHLRFKSWILAARPKTLSAALSPVCTGSALAAVHLANSGKKFIFLYSFLAFLSALCIQIGTNLINDALDFKKGTDNQDRLGPTRATQSGLLSYKQVMLAAGISFAIAAIVAVPLVLHGGVVILGLGLLSLLCGYLYTGGPFPLAYVGLGDLFVILFFGLFAVNGVFFLQTHLVGWDGIICGLQIGFLATVLIAINNLRDYEGDRKNHKRTLAARFGVTFARAEIVGLFFSVYVLNIYWWVRGLPWAALLPFLTLPLSIWICDGVLKNKPSPVFNTFLGMAALTQLLFAGLLSLGFLKSLGASS